MMSDFLLSLAKTWIGGLLIHGVIAHFSFVIPGEKLINNDDVLVFHHPTPSYPCHIIIVPKSKYISLEDLPSDDLAFEKALFLAVNELVDKFNLSSYRLLANGGDYQEVDHLHFHLISDDLPENPPTGTYR